MTYQILLDTDSVTVRYDKEHGYVYHTIHQPITGQPMREMLEVGLQALAQNQGKGWLSDDRKNGELSQEDVEYSIADWGPRTAKAGWKYWAIVVPETLAGRLSMSGVIEGFFELGVRVLVFTDLEEAQEWLASV